MKRPGLTWLEVLIALLVLGIVAALAAPRFSRAAPPPAPRATPLRESVRILRVAIERYYLDHRAYPAQHSDTAAPAASAAAFEAQLTRYTDEAGRVADARDAVHRFGPYLRDGIPAAPLPGGQRTAVHIVTGAQPPEPIPDAPEGWIYNCQTGQICANSPARDAAGVVFAHY